MPGSKMWRQRKRCSLRRRCKPLTFLVTASPDYSNPWMKMELTMKKSLLALGLLSALGLQACNQQSTPAAQDTAAPAAAAPGRRMGATNF